MSPFSAPGAGGWLSRTVTVKPHEAVLPAPSLAEQNTGVVPLGKVEPEDGAQVGTIGLQLSEAFAA